MPRDFLLTGKYHPNGKPSPLTLSVSPATLLPISQSVDLWKSTNDSSAAAERSISFAIN
jgi:hypothetical protein